MNSDLLKITFIFENCETATVLCKDIIDFDIKNIRRHMYYAGSVYQEKLTCKYIGICIEPTTYVSNTGEVEPLSDRLQQLDVTHIVLTMRVHKPYKDYPDNILLYHIEDIGETIEVPWRDKFCENRNTAMTVMNGNVITVVFEQQLNFLLLLK